MLGYSVERQTSFTWIRRGGAAVVDIGAADIDTVIGLMSRYADRPMDLADASLVWLAQQTGTYDILTIDQRDFAAYRAFGRKPFTNLLA
jgi:predicted nucleic acid-binding protein